MGKHHRIEPVLRRRRLSARPTGPLNGFLCQRCDRRFQVRGICDVCDVCAHAAARAHLPERVPGASGQ